ncbi:uncharacterized protein HMPREF1541_06352 [Cyphellophora europaea CBS 101466]|uniref:DUF3835 domain-containing protein n=1 Tax=Cyphellophora europaea (strain CBS 101466) TaxID=1220924 RepID=W2RRG9_CYPE1|nr:uncharacterized protein HMPREF1541_06352 [Cyphellophora europaea CBS 101466]ETN38318.1 hypothetical protein HMPREF1541_06352 [Cyphellophora europaea CBS 101466]
MDPAVLVRVETQRLALEESVARLRESLRHWQNLELDYEGLREEFELLPDTSSKEECLQAARDFKSVVVDEDDLQSLMRDAKNGDRSPRQLASLLSKRVDYVSRNADTIRKQILADEKKLNALLLVEDPELREDAGLPLTEITEELDDSGNVVSSKVERPGEETSALADVLEKAGVEGLKTKDGKLEVSDEPQSTNATVASSSKASLIKPSLPDVNEMDDDSSSADEELQRKDMPVTVPVPGENPIPVNIRDTAEEAKLRREMLEYGLDEVGAIVAELDLQENASDVSYDEDEDVGLVMDSDFEDDDDEDASEDEFGRVRAPVISEKYKQKMEELEKKLGLTDLKNLGPTPELPSHIQEALNRPPAAEAARKAAIAREEAVSSQYTAVSKLDRKGEKAKKKSVAFAENLDIAKEAPSHRKAEEAPPTKSAINPVGEAVIERSEPADSEPPAPPAPAPTKKTSHFKAAREAAGASPPAQTSTTSSQLPKSAASTKKNNQQAQPHPSGLALNQEDRPLVAPTVFERATPTSTLAPHPADIDDEMHRREIAMDYHKLRNRRIHAQGGFVRSTAEEDEEMEEMLGNSVLEDPETGEVKRVSRFKAARLMR